VTVYYETKPPTITAEGFVIGRNQSISWFNMSGGSAMESNPPTPIVTRHNGSEVTHKAWYPVMLCSLVEPNNTVQRATNVHIKFTSMFQETRPKKMSTG
jgi:hypothetical protein